jgi:hypothetical protein
MKAYRSKYGELSGTSYPEVMAAARREYHLTQKRTPRRVPYVRSRYFTKDKVFLNAFWDHLKQKHPSEQTKRLKFYLAALDLLRNTTYESDSVIEKNNPEVFLHRFSGQTQDGQYFYVQVKDNRRSGRKDFMSVFPKANKKASR